ncbi:bifunctional P-loop ATPase/acetyltransferase [Bibersteinia trehalosi USDA-ARS-USMARC-190]|uniref:Bifunctional P-loop ATPase/acetyltransferase n=1 Tax=Bibersteinia trehalosi USDA-ARS-USMARC-190 TaxID=1263832 RepID=W0R7K5_BIBTR|nr:GNAT family N-acetyltransferase [Bibersteinia trehalosi]AHG86275.1 bifunctional P-loop ATPase/acetyltransferase [Bibersteinia trehalosi USDA-ARS-USMARC-190]
MRKLVIINQTGVRSTPSQPSIQIPPHFEPIPFSNAKSLLGNEYPFAIYDMRAENGIHFNLEAFAIVAGTIQRGGTLYLCCKDWDNVENTLDLDSLRWNEDNAISTPRFWAFFKALVQKYGFECRGELHSPPKIATGLFQGEYNSPLQFTDDQQYILQNLPKHSADIHLITAPRGRGKSTLAGKLAEQLSQQHNVIITARSKAALPSFWQQIESENIQFFAPDYLLQAVQKGENVAKTWLFIDEAASLPLPMLKALTNAFEKVVMTTTTQNYEGTGRGFELKLPKMLEKSFQHWTLSQPLRWNENDPLEEFINELLLLGSRRGGPMCPPENVSLSEMGEHIGLPLQNLIDFYNLLSLAHYKTTPTDLRRLFDGENQKLFEIRENQQLIAGAWGIFEGGLDRELTQAIWRGERRPKGNLVAQYLCFQGNFPQACLLRSLRISRIAVAPKIQGKGYGKRLISEIILQISAQNPPLDFLSVSFGMNDELLNFWQQCGFQQVAISQNPEASSGLYSAMMIYPVSLRGKAFVDQASVQFQRNQILQKNVEFQPLTEWDWQNIKGFIHASRTFTACLPSLLRLAQIDKFTFVRDYLALEKLDKPRLQQFKTTLCHSLYFLN